MRSKFWKRTIVLRLTEGHCANRTRAVLGADRRRAEAPSKWFRLITLSEWWTEADNQVKTVFRGGPV